MVHTVEDPPEHIIKRYLEQHLVKCDKLTQQEKDQLIARHIQVLGTRFLHAKYAFESSVKKNF